MCLYYQLIRLYLRIKLVFSRSLYIFAIFGCCYVVVLFCFYFICKLGGYSASCAAMSYPEIGAMVSIMILLKFLFQDFAQGRGEGKC